MSQEYAFKSTAGYLSGSWAEDTCSLNLEVLRQLDQTALKDETHSKPECRFL